MTSRFAVLAICTANICRSPLMEGVLRARLDPERYEVASAGVRGFDRAPMDAMAAMELMRLGRPEPVGFRSQRLETFQISAAGLILTATRQHRSDVLSLDPLALRRTFTLREFAALVQTIEPGSTTAAGLVEEAARRRSLAPADVDVRDPYRRSPEVHRAAAAEIDAACDHIAARLNIARAA